MARKNLAPPALAKPEKTQPRSRSIHVDDADALNEITLPLTALKRLLGDAQENDLYMLIAPHVDRLQLINASIKGGGA